VWQYLVDETKEVRNFHNMPDGLLNQSLARRSRLLESRLQQHVAPVAQLLKLQPRVSRHFTPSHSI